MNQLIKTQNETTVGHELSACQKDLLLTILEQVQHFDTAHKLYITSADEVEKKTGRKWSLEQFEEDMKVLGNHTFILETQEFYRQFWLFQHTNYNSDNGEIEILFSQTGLKIMQSIRYNLQQNSYSKVFLLE